MKPIAICIMIQNDQEYISEWLDHHRDLGIDHFYLYDNESTPRYENLGDDVTITYSNGNVICYVELAGKVCLLVRNKR